MTENPFVRCLVLIGGGALLIAMATDFLAVIGRHVGLPLLGSIEIVRAMVLVAGSVAMLMATLAGTHAVVHLLIDRLKPGPRGAMLRINRLCSSLFFVALAAGSLWLASDMWGGHEEGEITGIPYAPLRIVAILACAGAALIFLAQSLRRGRP